MSRHYPFADAEDVVEKEHSAIVSFIVAHPKTAFFLYSATLVLAVLAGSLL